MTAVKYELLIDDKPATPDLLAAIEQIEVEDHADMADMLRLRVTIIVREGRDDWGVLDEETFYRLANIKLKVTVGSAQSEPLIDAYVIESSVDFSSEPGQSTLNVVAMDPTVLMNLEEKIKPWPNMADSDIATAIFGEYTLTPKVKQTQPSRQEVDTVTIQRGTDIQFLRQLAQRNGYECYVETDSQGANVGYFRPPQLEQSPQGVLSVNLGTATNVDAFNARYDMLGPTTVQATGLDVADLSDQQAKVESAALSGLGKTTVMSSKYPRKVLLSRTGLAQTGELQTYAQAVTDRSAWAITAQGELNTVAYGGILRAKRTVNVRGAGKQFSGTYYVQKVLHAFTGEGYTQRFTLRRNALGLKGTESFVENKALSPSTS